MAAQVQAVAPMAIVVAADPVLKRKQEKQEVEDEELQVFKRQETRFEHFSLICGRLYLELSDGFSAAKSADNIFTSTPADATYLLSDYRKAELHRDIDRFLKDVDYPQNRKDELRRSLLILYSTCLLNSRFGKCVDSLERELPAMLAQSKTGPALIEEATKILSLPIPEQIDDIQKLQGVVINALGRVDSYLNLFIYHDAEFQEPIQNIYTFTRRYGDVPRFPICKSQFPALVQQLAISQHEKAKIKELKVGLFQLSENLRFKLAGLFQKKSELEKAREDVLNHHAVVLWECGAHILDEGIKTLFREKKTTRSYIPDDFAVSMNLVARNEREFGRLTFRNFLHIGVPNLPPRYVWEVWTMYLGKEHIFVDISDFMRFIVAKLPAQSFQQLEAGLRKDPDSRKEAVLRVLTDYFRTQFRGSPSMAMLKRWVEKASL
ncbi:MAG: hypothetical protein K1X28_07010 [Parachlamydiales bacterium]|nr:hypothetical protein [Parachlamydiales bacterium]